MQSPRDDAVEVDRGVTAYEDTAIGAQPRPRLLFVGIDVTDPLAAKAATVVPTIGFADSVHSGVRGDEWDAVVTRDLDQACLLNVAGRSDYAHADRRLCVFVAFDMSTRIVERAVSSPDDDSLVLHVGTAPVTANRFRLPPAVPAGVEALVRDQLIPAVQRRPGGLQTIVTADVAEVIRSVRRTSSDADIDKAAREFVAPFATTLDGRALAGSYERSYVSECWVVPSDAGDMWPWLLAALDRWHDQWPHRFPRVNDWRTDPEWFTPAELDVHEKLVATERSRLRVLSELADRARVLAAEMAAASDTAVAGPKRLLFTQGDDLVAAVTDTLEELGFEVINSDETAAPGQRLEDLEVRDPDAPGWVAVVEVRGYKRGAAANDIGRIARHVEHYQARHGGRRPDSRWYIANQNIGQHPDTRRPILHNDQPLLDRFSEDGGLTIDTTDLYRLLLAVQTEHATKRDARAGLRSGRGRYEAPTGATSATGPE